MDHVRLGTTGLKVSRLCLGTMTYGTPAWRPWVLDEATSRPFITRALEHGINFFDTADVYSLGVSEEVVGRALRDMAKRHEFVIATKVNDGKGRVFYSTLGHADTAWDNPVLQQMHFKALRWALGLVEGDVTPLPKQ